MLVKLTKNVSGKGFNQIAPEHGLTRGRILKVLKIEFGRPYVKTDVGEEMRLKLSEFEAVL